VIEEEVEGKKKVAQVERGKTLSEEEIRNNG